MHADLRDLLKRHGPWLVFWFLAHLGLFLWMDLHPDSAYYWVWSRRPAWGYFDHPPLAAWLLRVASGAFGVFLINQLLILFALVFLLLWLIRVRGEDPPLFWPVVWALPLLQAGTLAYTPDTPFLLELVVLMLLVEIWRTSPESRSLAAGVGVLLGAMVLTKYTAFPVIAVLLALSLTPSWRWVWKQAVWILLPALFLLIPHGLWLVAHQGISLTFQLKHGLGGGWSVRWLPEYLLGQWVVLGPLTVLALIPGAKARRISVPWDLWLRWMTLGIYGFFAWSSLRHRVEANWPMAASLALLLWLWSRREQPGSVARTAIGINLLLLLVLLGHMAHPFLPLRKDPARLFHGWKSLAAKVEHRVGQSPLYANQYQIAAELSLYLKRMVPSLNRMGRPNQYDLWPDLRPDPGDTLWWITEPYTLPTVTVLAVETLATPMGPRVLARVVWKEP